MALLHVRTPGLVGYEEALALQQSLVAERQRGAIPDTLLLLEHPATVTLTRRCTERDLRLSGEQLARLGLVVARTGRGGLATLHSPGQLVGYLIFALSEHGRDLHRFLRHIEASLIAVASALDVPAGRVDGLTGVWVGGRKLASIGIAVHRWVSYHGFALNVRNDLGLFRAIVPCGLAQVEMTSLERERDSAPAWAQVLDLAAEAIAGQFGFDRVVRLDTLPALECAYHGSE